MKQYPLAVFFIVVLLMSCSRPMFAEDANQDEQAAVTAAEAWLKTIDNGEYGQGWQQASDYLQKAVTQEQFEQALTGVRKPLGEMKSRELKDATHATSLPGAPDGDYYVIQFESSFDNKQSAVETITPMKTADGAWRVSGYFIK